MRIGIIGSGISGLGAAYALAPHHDVTVLESASRAGGHSNTIDVDYDGTSIAVDTGFIVYNELNYPNLTALFAQLNIATEESSMSFAISRDQGKLEWGGDSFSSLFAQKRNLFSPRFLFMLRELLRFNREAKADRARLSMSHLSLGDYLAQGRYGQAFINDYLLPMSAAIWSTPAQEILDFPAESFIAFFDNHCLLTGLEGRPIWRTVTGGSRQYVNAIKNVLGPRLHLDHAVKLVRRTDTGIEVIADGRDTMTFDKVVFATHGDITNRLLADADRHEKAVLSAVRYAPNKAYVHRDINLMPRRKAVWSSWNYLAEAGADETLPVTVTYWMNRLQNLDPTRPLFVTLNPKAPPRADLTFAVLDYDHPQFDAATINAQRALAQIQGRGGLYYGGAWTGHGFHEDGLRSGLNVARLIGAAIPWAPDVPTLKAAQ
jgi:predicted NAD/FAD-binding protein